MKGHNVWSNENKTLKLGFRTIMFGQMKKKPIKTRHQRHSLVKWKKNNIKAGFQNHCVRSKKVLKLSWRVIICSNKPKTPNEYWSLSPVSRLVSKISSRDVRSVQGFDFSEMIISKIRTEHRDLGFWQDPEWRAENTIKKEALLLCTCVPKLSHAAATVMLVTAFVFYAKGQVFESRSRQTLVVKQAATVSLPEVRKQVWM